MLLFALAWISLGCSEMSCSTSRVRKTRDGRTFVFDSCANAWRLDDSSMEKAEEWEQLALPWSQFNVSFQGQFQIAGIPILLGEDPDRRPQGSQEHADTGNSIWDGAVALAKVLERQPQLVRGRKVLELGAGRGLAGLAASALGADVVLTDLAYCREAMEQAVRLTTGSQALVSSRVEVAELDWLQAEAFFESRPELKLDVVLAADVVWLMDLVEPLADAIRVAAGYNPQVEILVVHQTRSSNVERAFLEAMTARDLRLKWTVAGDSHGHVQWHEDFVPDQRIKLWCFHLPGTAG
ncbi:unnamed protein product [Effrenium voratum]|nr:unnamed protein product [Effrenium voratum]